MKQKLNWHRTKKYHAIRDLYIYYFNKHQMSFEECAGVYCIKQQMKPNFNWEYKHIYIYFFNKNKKMFELCAGKYLITKEK